jgi:hypothetical protein
LLRSIDAPLLDATERGLYAKQKRLALHSLGPTRDRRGAGRGQNVHHQRHDASNG